MTAPVTSLFTFGYSQLCPYTGTDLGDHYALVTAPDRSSARLFMNTAFKRNYAFEYDGPGDVRICDYLPRMTLHITVNLVPEQPMPPVAEYAADPLGQRYSRADDGETTQAIGVREPLHTGAMTEGGLVDESEAEPVHMAYAWSGTVCGLPAEGCANRRQSFVWREVTCKACIDGLPQSAD